MPTRHVMKTPKAISKLLINITTKCGYLPTTLISDEDSAFVSHVDKEAAGVLRITVRHATTKHAQTIGMLERSHMSPKQAFKIETGERRSLWHKYVSITVLNYIHLTAQVMAVNRAELFMDAFLKKS